MCYSEYMFDEYTFIIVAPGTGSGAGPSTAETTAARKLRRTDNSSFTTGYGA
jgi:hypothetical protein